MLLYDDAYNLSVQKEAHLAIGIGLTSDRHFESIFNNKQLTDRSITFIPIIYYIIPIFTFIPMVVLNSIFDN